MKRSFQKTMFFMMAPALMLLLLFTALVSAEAGAGNTVPYDAAAAGENDVVGDNAVKESVTDNTVLPVDPIEPIVPLDPTEPILPIPITPTMPVNPFTDVFGTDWYIDAVIYVYNNGLMSGTSAEPMLFSPGGVMTRAMLVTILWRMDGANVERIPAAAGGGQFTDVAEEAYYYQAVNWAASNGITGGVGNNLFAPDALITRQDLAVILLQYMNYLDINLPVTREWIIFADGDEIADYAMDAIQTFKKLGIISGLGVNENGLSIINPRGLTTRAQFASMLQRFAAAIEGH